MTLWGNTIIVVATLLLTTQCSQEKGAAVDSGVGLHDAAIPVVDGSTPEPDADIQKTVAQCYEGVFVNGPPTLDYDQFDPVVGRHCLGTNHQDIKDVERVVFLGDSVTVGTPPTLTEDFYRSELAERLASKFGIEAPGPLWENVDLVGGTSLVKDEGAFSSCSRWGARTDDFMDDQLPDCFPQETQDKTTLVIMTMGGNDVSSLARDATDGMAEEELWAATEEFVQYQREALDWLVEPGRFPNGIFVVFANVYEFTDGTADVEACEASELAGFEDPVPQPELLIDMVEWANEQYVKMAVETQTDVIFMLEEFCGHGMRADDPTAPCYRGPGNSTWFDATCIHPNPTGHNVLTHMFMAVVEH